MATDLDAAIRAKLDGWAPVRRAEGYPGPEFTCTTDEHLPPHEAERWRAAWERMKGEPPSGRLYIVYSGQFYLGFEQMRAAIEVVLDLHGGNHLGHLCPDPAKNYSDQRWYEADNPEDACPTVRAIAEKLGMAADRT